uniref:Uncharacterized protein n=1 Tax=Candidatus Kentrum sp. LPFa TaxID=2126335 RepID=A0A450WFG6_9GAMM|nr:MAG: hypothetical protein BECKLPF1236B_GA0070989_108217 [Candidatus Kentron sp. LPFa]
MIFSQICAELDQYLPITLAASHLTMSLLRDLPGMNVLLQNLFWFLLLPPLKIALLIDPWGL